MQTRGYEFWQGQLSFNALVMSIGRIGDILLLTVKGMRLVSEISCVRYHIGVIESL